MPHSNQSVSKNHILSVLPAAEFAMLGPDLTYVELELGQNLHRAGDRVDYVFFPESGFISALAVLADGHPIEIGLIGTEGVVGVNVVLGSTHSYSETMCQTGGAHFAFPRQSCWRRSSVVLSCAA